MMPHSLIGLIETFALVVSAAYYGRFDDRKVPSEMRHAPHPEHSTEATDAVAT